MFPISSSAPRLVERLVEVAALRALHAGGAAVLARALADQPGGVGDQALELVVAAAGDPDPAGVAVVDEDRRQAGLEVDVGGEPADVPAIAHRQQRQDRDLGVLGGVQRAELDLGRQRLGPGELVGEHVPERLGREVLLRQVERDEVEHLVVVGRGACAGRRSPARSPRPRRSGARRPRPMRARRRSARCRPRSPLAAACTSRRRTARRSRGGRSTSSSRDLVGAAEVQVDRARDGRS